MACDIDNREGKSPSLLEPRLGRMLHSSATGRRHHELFPGTDALSSRLAAAPAKKHEYARFPAHRSCSSANDEILVA